MAGEQDQSKQSTDELPAAAAAAPQRPAGRLALLLAVVAVLLAGATIALQQQHVANADKRLEALANARSDELAAVEARLRSEIQGATRIARDAMERVELGERALSELRQEVGALTAADRSDWMLAEVEYLLRLANQRVLMEDDNLGAERILQQADRLLLELDEQRLFAVRAAVADDIAAARAAGVLDTEGIFLRLSAAAGRIDELPLLVPSAEARAAYRSQSERIISEDVGTLQAAALRVWDKLRGLIVIRHREDHVRPLLPPDQEYYLRHNLRMLLSQAQLALLRNSDALYRQSLNAALDWLRAYFPADSSEVQAVRDSLQELGQFDVGPRKPDVSRGLRALRDYLSGRHLQTPAATGAAGEA